MKDIRKSNTQKIRQHQSSFFKHQSQEEKQIYQNKEKLTRRNSIKMEGRQFIKHKEPE